MHRSVVEFKTWEETQLFLIMTLTRKAVIPIIMCLSTVFFLAYDSAPRAALIAWLIFSFIAIIIQGVVGYIVYTRQLLLEIKLRRYLIIFFAFFDGVILSIASVFSIHCDVFSFFFINFILFALCLGATLTTVGSKDVYFVISIPIIVVISAVFIFHSEAASLDLVTAVIVIATWVSAVLFLLKLNDFIAEVFKSSYQIRMREKNTNEQLQLALENAEQSNKDKTRFLAAASHDLRQPINALSILSSVLNMQQLEGRVQEVAKNMNVAIDALAHQLDSLLDISKLDAGIIETNPEVFHLGEELKNLFEEFKPLAVQKDLEFELTNFEEAWAYTDKYLLDRVLRNLLTNAFKYTEQGGISIKLHAEPNFYRLCIIDTGIGIDKKEQQRVFDEFYQLHNQERDRKDGLGLGLSIVKRLSELLNFNVTIDSTFGKGSTFTLVIKRAHKIETNAHQSDIQQPALLDILVIEDDELILSAMRSLLESLGHFMLAASSTQQAKHILKGYRPDIVLADLRLRGDDDGLSAIQAVQEAYPNTPAIIITGDTAPQRLQLARASQYKILYKPVKVEMLNQAINEVLAE